MDLVRQEHPHGCGVAVAAMITGQSYADVASDFDEETLTTKHGIYPFELERWLEANGCALTPVVYAQVSDHKEAPEGHFVAVLPDGTVLDPNEDERHHISDYGYIERIVGVVKRG